MISIFGLYATKDGRGIFSLTIPWRIMRPIGLWLKWHASTTASVASGVRFLDVMRCWVSLYLKPKIKQHDRRACENDEVIRVNNQAGFLKENRLDL